jgi:hypothetical protein
LSAILLQADEQAKSNLRMFLLDLLEAKIPNLEKAILSKAELSSIFTQEQLAHYSSRVKTAPRALKPSWHGQPDTISNYAPLNLNHKTNIMLRFRKSKAAKRSVGTKADFEHRPY